MHLKIDRFTKLTLIYPTVPWPDASFVIEKLSGEITTRQCAVELSAINCDEFHVGPIPAVGYHVYCTACLCPDVSCHQWCWLRSHSIGHML